MTVVIIQLHVFVSLIVALFLLKCMVLVSLLKKKKTQIKVMTAVTIIGLSLHYFCFITLGIIDAFPEVHHVHQHRFLLTQM